MGGPGTHSTNYIDTFITVAPDSAARRGSAPPDREKPSMAALAFRMLDGHPYEYTSDDVIFTVWADRHEIARKDRAKARATFFSKGQPCLRSSDLAKKYGWGIHSDAQGRVALVGVATPEYAAFATGARTVVLKPAMRTTRK